MLKSVTAAFAMISLITVSALAESKPETTSSSPSATTQEANPPVSPPGAATPSGETQLIEQPLEQAPPSPPELIRLASPTEGAEITGRRPEIRIEFSISIQPETLLLILDGTDITQLASVNPQGVVYKPFMTLPAGGHTMQVTARGIDGSDLSRSFSFVSRHGETFKEAASTNDLTATYEAALARTHNKAVTPTHKFESNLRSETTIKSQDFSFGFSTNVRYFDQSLPVQSPLRKGVDMVNYLMSLGYTHEQVKAQVSVGDVMLNETAYTVYNYARRGGLLSLEYNTVYLRLFNVRSDQVFGLRGSMLPEFNSTSNLRGVAGGIKLFNNLVEARLTHVTGGETSTGFNVAGTAGSKQGNVTGVLLTTDLFENRLRTELEGAWSQFDPDTSDEFGRSGSQAYRAKIGGYLQPANYELKYERVGKNFVSIGNLNGVLKDRETISGRGGVTIDTHTFSVSGQRQYDNLTLDPTKPRLTSYQATFDYNCSTFPQVPLGLNYQKGLTLSSHEPDQGGVIVRTGLQTDTVGGRVGYSAAPLSIMAMTSFSRQNDTEATNNDTTILTYTLTPSYTAQNLNVMTNFQLLQNKSRITDVRTDTMTATLDIRSRWWEERVSVDLGGTWSQTTNTNNTTDTWNMVTNARIGYALPPFWGGFLKPSIALRGTYNHTSDRLNSTNRDEATLFLVLATAIPFVF